MLSYRTSARRSWASWLVLAGSIALIIAPFLAGRPETSTAWVCLAMGALGLIGASSVLFLNPSWGSEVRGRDLMWWHEAKRLKRTVSVDELRAVYVMRVGNVAHLELGDERSVALPRECMKQDAVRWAQELHAQFPHVELHVD